MPEKQYEPITAKQIMNRVKEERMPFEWSINPYRGCAHGCSFCYARAFQSFIGLGAEDEFQHHILLKTNAAEALEAQLVRMAKRVGSAAVARQVGLVAIGTATDPYQPIEGREQLTRSCLKVLAKYRIPVTITTRSPLILRDLDILREVPVASVNISIHTLDAGITRRLEPATPHPLKRLEALQQLAQNGIPTGIFAAPILPFLTDSREQLDALFAAARKHQASFAMSSLLRLSPDVKAWFYKTLREYDPRLLSAYAKLYTGAYPERSYSHSIQTMTDELRQKYGLTKELPREPLSASSCPASQLFANRDEKNSFLYSPEEPQVEQLSFDF